jgi:hypothetical protein
MPHVGMPGSIKGHMPPSEKRPFPADLPATPFDMPSAMEHYRKIRNLLVLR